MLQNTVLNYIHGFELWHALRPIAVMARTAVDDPEDALRVNGRITPTSRIGCDFLIGATAGSRTAAKPDSADGRRARQFIHAARQLHKLGRYIGALAARDAD